MVVGITEHVLERPLRSVLDVGCGEGEWQPVLKGVRPGVRYVGIDSSEYVVRRFGRRRNLRLGSLATLDQHAWRRPFDLVVCADVLHYVPARELGSGLLHLRELVGGVAYLTAFTSEDDPRGDLRGWHRRTSAYYRRLFGDLGLVPCGMQCWIPPELSARATALERGGR